MSTYQWCLVFCLMFILRAIKPCQRRRAELTLLHKEILVQTGMLARQRLETFWQTPGPGHGLARLERVAAGPTAAAGRGRQWQHYTRKKRRTRWCVAWKRKMMHKLYYLLTPSGFLLEVVYDSNTVTKTQLWLLLYKYLLESYIYIYSYKVILKTNLFISFLHFQTQPLKSYSWFIFLMFDSNLVQNDF
jgi:hypothetical protein